MEKKAPPPLTSPVLGIRRGRHAKHKPKRFFRRLVSYLKSDSYMYAPLISSSRSSSSKRKYGLFARDGLFVNREGLEIGAGDYGKKKRLMEMIGEYLKSDSYMYAPLLEGECTVVAPKKIVDSSHRGTPLTKSLTTSIATTVLTRITNNQSTEESTDVITKGQTEPLLDSNHELDNLINHTLKQAEIVKKVVYPNCWTSLLSVGDDNISRGSIAERVAHRRKISIE